MLYTLGYTSKQYQSTTGSRSIARPRKTRHPHDFREFRECSIDADVDSVHHFVLLLFLLCKIAFRRYEQTCVTYEVRTCPLTTGRVLQASANPRSVRESSYVRASRLRFCSR